MTDAERLHLREHFLEPETRCGFFVDENRKKLWKCMLDMLEMFDGVCRRHGLRYFLFYGSLLGAVRHKGFIPWDDDVDIVMPRSDFDRAQEILRSGLATPYFLQNADTDREYATSFFKIRNSDTAAITPFWVDRHIVVNLGIFIDVHSIDGIPKLRCSSKFLNFARNHMQQVMQAKSRSGVSMPGGARGMIGRAASALLGLGMDKGFVPAISKLANFAKFGTTEKSGITPFFYGYLPPRHQYPTEWFDEAQEADFEYLRVFLPRRAEELLTAEYGDWRKFVKGTEGGAQHQWMRYDTERDYKTVLVEEYGYKPEEFLPGGRSRG